MSMNMNIAANRIATAAAKKITANENKAAATAKRAADAAATAAKREERKLEKTNPVFTAATAAKAFANMSATKAAEKKAAAEAITAARKAKQAAEEIVKVAAPKAPVAQPLTAEEIKELSSKINYTVSVATKTTKAILWDINNPKAVNEKTIMRSQAMDKYGERFSDVFAVADTLIDKDVDEMESLRLEMLLSKFAEKHILCAHTGSMNRNVSGFYIRNWRDNNNREEFLDWALCGLKLEEIGKAANKALTYLGLCFSSATPMMEKFGVEFKLDDVCVLPDEDVDIVGKCDVIDTDNNVTLDADYTQHRNGTDGRISHRVASLKDHPFSVRMLSIVKGLATYAPHEFVGHATDIWGNDIDLTTKNVIIRKSAFKIGAPNKSQNGCFHSCDEFINAAKERNARFYVCRDFSNVKRCWSCYQDLQTAFCMTDSELVECVNHTVEFVNKRRMPQNAWQMLEQNAGSIAKLDNRLYNNMFVRMWMQEGYESMLDRIFNGCIPNVGWYLPVTVDTTGKLHGNQIHCGLLHDGQEVDLARKPLIGPDGHFVAVNVADYVACDEQVIYVAMDSMFWQCANADMDGDAPELIDFKPIVEAVKRTQAEVGSKPVVFPEADKEASKPLTADAIIKYSKGRWVELSNVGQYVNQATAMLADGMYDREQFAILTYGANDAVNAAKHDTTATVNTGDELTKVVQPEFRKYGKNKAKKTHLTDGIVDRYMLKCKEVLPKSFSVIGMTDEEYDPLYGISADERVSILSRNDYSLFAKKIYTNSVRNHENDGIFHKLAFSKAGDYNEMRANDEMSTALAFDNRMMARNELRHAIDELNIEGNTDIRYFDAYMVIAHLIFGRLSDIIGARNVNYASKEDLEKDAKRAALYERTFGEQLTGQRVNGLKEQLVRFFFSIFAEEATTVAEQYSNDRIDEIDIDEIVEDADFDFDIDAE